MTLRFLFCFHLFWLKFMNIHTSKIIPILVECILNGLKFPLAQRISRSFYVVDESSELGSCLHAWVWSLDWMSAQKFVERSYNYRCTGKSGLCKGRFICHSDRVYLHSAMNLVCDPYLPDLAGFLMGLPLFPCIGLLHVPFPFKLFTWPIWQ